MRRSSYFIINIAIVTSYRIKYAQIIVMDGLGWLDTLNPDGIYIDENFLIYKKNFPAIYL